MQRDIPIGLGAGLAAAILAIAPASGSALGLMLAFFAALPITLVTLSWGYRAGLTAAAASVGILAALASVSTGLGFGATFALPAWGLAYLAIAGFDSNRQSEGQIALGTLGVVAAILGVTSVLFTMLLSGSSYTDSVLAAEKELVEAYRIMMSVPKDQPIVQPDGSDATAIIHFFGRFVLPMQAFMMTIASLSGLWLSGRIALISGRLPRPWPDVAATYRLPGLSLAILGLGCLISLLPDVYGFGGQLLVAAMFGALAIQGFAVVHFVTRGNAIRPLLLAGFYMLFVLLSSIVLIVIAVVGLIDLFFNLRRQSGSSGRPQSPPPLN
jgi:Predicted membrane protein (DUF2232)